MLTPVRLGHPPRISNGCGACLYRLDDIPVNGKRVRGWWDGNPRRADR